MAVTVGYNLIEAEFNGRNGTGTISLPGLKAGDRMFWQSINGSYTGIDNSFEAIVSNDNALEQLSGADKTGQSIVAIFIRI